MDKTEEYAGYAAVLEHELVPAMGCTEPIAVSYAAAIAAKRLGGFPERMLAEVSANIVKNVKSVVVPNTGGLCGIEAAVIAGFVAAAPEAKLEVLAKITPEGRAQIAQHMKDRTVEVVPTREPDVFFIRVEGELAGKTISVTIRSSHTNVTRIVENGETVFEHNDVPQQEEPPEASWSIPALIDAAREMPLEKVEPLIARQIRCNMEIAQEGLEHPWGASVGATLVRRAQERGDAVFAARGTAAAASDARMNGCEMPVVIISGSGNQGITACVPVVVFAQTLKAQPEALIRAVLLSDLVTICLKQGIGKLSAYCGAIAAGAGAAAGIAFLKNASDQVISDSITNALAVASGIICDGAKSSCAGKIALSVENAAMAVSMAEEGHVYKSGDGIVQASVDGTARAVGRIASRGMVGTDREIIDVMLGR